jgi:hypothetical protein
MNTQYTSDQPTPRRQALISSDPRSFPGLVSFWDFKTRLPQGAWPASAGANPYTLLEQAGPLSTVEDDKAPLGGNPLELPEGKWLAIPRPHCPGLDIHGKEGHLTVMAWIKRGQTLKPGCEFIAGQWNETNLGRQYGLFINIRTWNGSDQICGHLSTTGGPTPGFKYCYDGPIGKTPIDRETWHCIGMSYDGRQGYAWLDGFLDEQPRINPYLLPGGLHDGGPAGSDFTVGAVDRDGQVGNFFAGRIAGVAVYNRCLSPAEIWAVSQFER